MTDYLKLDFVLHPVFPLQDILPVELADAGFDVFEENSVGFSAYIPQDLYNESAVLAVVNTFKKEGDISFTVHKIAGQNWNAEWESGFKPVILEGKFAICAGFHTPPPGIPLVIWVEPRMAFGTGHHPTTYLMASHLIEEDCTGLQVLDMGCGTGILSIMAEKKGAKSVLAIDNEQPAIENTLDNLKLNNCSIVSVEKGSAERLINRHFNLILANINRNVLWEHIPVYKEVLIKGGKLWLSGFYSADVPLLTQRLNAVGIKVISVFSKDDWQLMKCEIV